MNNLKLVTTENFGSISCDFYRNMNDDILLTREQIGSALEYANPGKAIQKILLKHKDRLDPLSMRCKEIRYPPIWRAGIPDKDVRTLFEHMVNDLLDRYKLKSDLDEEYTVRKAIFT